jgi:hypothetical protein
MAHRQVAADNGSGKFKVRALIRLLPVVLILLPMVLILLLNFFWFTIIKSIEIESRSSCRPSKPLTTRLNPVAFLNFWNTGSMTLVYTLSQNYPYEHRLTTPKGVNYYVKSTKFERDYPLDSRERVTIEERVEREYFGIFRQNCQIELQRRQLGYIRETPHCDMLRIFDLVR